MRSDAKASTAGSNLRQAKGLGRIFRGAGATRGGSGDADGSGAPSGGRRPLFFLAALVLTALVAFTASVASGAPAVTEYVKSFGRDGTESSDFQKINGVAVDQQTGYVYVLDNEAGALYKFEADGTPLDWGGTAGYISENQITGLEPYLGYNESQVAVDSTTHVIYVTEKNSVRAFHEDGEPAEFTSGPGVGTSEIPIAGELVGVTVDQNGSVYANDYAGTVSIFSSSGEPITTVAVPAASGNLGVGLDGTIYVVNVLPSSGEGGVHRFAPDEFPVSGTTTYTAESKLDPFPYFSYGVGLDPANGDIYVLEVNFSSSWIAKYDSAGTLLGYLGKPGEAGESTGIGQGVAVVGGGEEFQLYVGSNSDAPKVAIFGEVINPGPPDVKSLSAHDVSATSATLRAEINPNTFATAYRFEYGFEDCAVSTCTSAPPSDAPIGAGHHFVAVSQDLGGLQPDTTYHYRVLATNSVDTTERSGTFHTEGTGLGFQLIDRRVWEMVSPSDKNGALVSRRVALAHIKAAADGDGLVYATNGSIEPDPQGNRTADGSTLARRDQSGRWLSKDLATPNSRVINVPIGQTREYKLFTPDLSEALLEPRDGTNLSPEASERAPFWRQNSEPPVYRPLVTGKEGFANVPPGTEFGREGVIGAVQSSVSIVQATPDLDHVVLKSTVPLAAGAPNDALYKWFDGQLEPISWLPEAEGGSIVSGNPGHGFSGINSTRHAISDEGSRIFWTSQSPSHLYVRDTDSDETTRLDLTPTGKSGPGASNPVFQGASADGSVVYFTDSAQLTADASPSGADLYRCELPLGAPLTGCANLTDLSAPLPGSGESAEVLGVAPAISEDGSRVYFVARAELDTEANEAGDSALPGEPNLYAWQEGMGVRFIATLAEEDRNDWGGLSAFGAQVGALSATSSPSGRYLAFTSERSLAGEASLDVTSQPVQRIFRYDLLTERLECISCNPTGSAPEGQVMASDSAELIDPRGVWKGALVGATLPEPPVIDGSGATIYRSRVVHDSGRVFFNAIDPLVPADSNGEWDVYQYEPSGLGTCSASSADAATSLSAGGCVSLISSGSAEEPAGFFDASVGGDDVFFLTTARLSVLDEDKEADVYDARVDGVAAVLPSNAECLGEACQPAAIAPNDPTPASAGFKGAGNPKPKARKRCAKGKRAVRRKGRARCVPRKSQRHNHRARHGRRAAR